MGYVFLLIPCLLAVATPLYNRLDPYLFGFPLFYWYLLALIPLSSLFIWLGWKAGAK